MNRPLFLLLAVMVSATTRAQDESSPTEITIESINDKWYASPWVWVAGAALIIVLLVVLSQGKENKR
ncbi:MAG: hypothetical protein M3Q06_12975 [Bacteroidota bacterium]|nr:hypothetical protein [Bacteroidota bacterium]